MEIRTVAEKVPMTEIGFGASQLGNLYRAITDQQATETVHAAWNAGIRYFDTAPHYGLGLSEDRLGAALVDKPRDEYVVSSKVGRLIEPNPPGGSGTDTEGFDVPDDRRRVWDLSRDGIRRSIEATLARSGLDRIDIAYLHDPDEREAEAIRDALPALIELRNEGVVSAVGAGMNQSAMLTRFIEQTDIDVVMVAGRLTLLDQSALTDLLPAAHQRGVSVVAAAVYNSGLLARPRPALDAKYDYGDAPERLIRHAEALASVCERHGVDLPTAAVAFPLRFTSVASVVVGARSATQLEGTMARYSTAVPEELWAELEQLGYIDVNPELLEHS